MSDRPVVYVGADAHRYLPTYYGFADLATVHPPEWVWVPWNQTDLPRVGRTRPLRDRFAEVFIKGYEQGNQDAPCGDGREMYEKFKAWYEPGAMEAPDPKRSLAAGDVVTLQGDCPKHCEEGLVRLSYQERWEIPHGKCPSCDERGCVVVGSARIAETLRVVETMTRWDLSGSGLGDTLIARRSPDTEHGGLTLWRRGQWSRPHAGGNWSEARWGLRLENVEATDA